MISIPQLLSGRHIALPQLGSLREAWELATVKVCALSAMQNVGFFTPGSEWAGLWVKSAFHLAGLKC